MFTDTRTGQVVFRISKLAATIKTTYFDKMQNSSSNENESQQTGFIATVLPPTVKNYSYEGVVIMRVTYTEGQEESSTFEHETEYMGVPVSQLQ
jgi:hypothetical protein